MCSCNGKKTSVRRGAPANQAENRASEPSIDVVCGADRKAQVDLVLVEPQCPQWPVSSRY